MKPALDSLDFGPRLDIWANSLTGAHAPLPFENQDNLLLIDAHGRALMLRDQRALLQQLPDWPAGHVRLAVLDGLGGHGRGREAAEAVAAALLSMPACASVGELSTRLDALHTGLQHHFDPTGDATKRPGTTLTLLELRPGKAPLLYHVGDSRLYEVTEAQVTPLTVDHVPATAFALGGLLDEAEWWQQVHGEHRSQISQAFILGNALLNPGALSDPLLELSAVNLPPFLYHLGDRRAFELRSDALYLLATDGFWACAEPYDWVARWPELLCDGAPSARAAIGALFNEIAQRAPDDLHIDNITAIALRLRPFHAAQAVT